MKGKPHTLFLPCPSSGRPIHLPDHHVSAGQEHAIALRDDQSAAAGEGEWGVHDGPAEGDAGGACQATGAAETAAGPGTEVAGTDAGHRRAECPAGGAGTQAQGTDGQRRWRSHAQLWVQAGRGLHIGLLFRRISLFRHGSCGNHTRCHGHSNQRFAWGGGG